MINRATVGISKPLVFNGLDDVIPKRNHDYFDPQRVSEVLTFLNGLRPVKGGFISENYSPAGLAKRLYFTEANAEKADAIRQQLETWRQQSLVNDDEYYYLLSALLLAVDQCANTTSVYGAYLKKFKPSALVALKLTKIPIYLDSLNHIVYNEDADSLVKKISADVFYLDPPYNTRQYASNYHVLEMIARYDTTTVLHGKTGLYDYKAQKSDFSSKQLVKEALTNLVDNIDGQYIFLSYNDEGILPLSEIKEVLSRRRDYGFFTHEYRQYKDDSLRRQAKPATVEYLHYVKIKH